MPENNEGSTDSAARWTAVSGLTLLADTRGSGEVAARGSAVVYNARFYLRRGEEVTHDHQSIRRYGERLNTRLVEGTELIDHHTVLGSPSPPLKSQSTACRPAVIGRFLPAPIFAMATVGWPVRFPRGQCYGSNCGFER